MTVEYRYTFLSILSVSSRNPSAIPISNTKVTAGCISTKNRSQITAACYPTSLSCLERTRPFPKQFCSSADCRRLLRSPLVILSWRDPKATQRRRNKLWMGISFARAVFLFWMKTAPLLHRKARKQRCTQPVHFNPLQLFNSFLPPCVYPYFLLDSPCRADSFSTKQRVR